jgi:hypothetical protein
LKAAAPVKADAAAGTTGSRSASPLSYFEFWPGWLFYTPVVIHWLALGLRYGDFSLPTAANPFIETGGLCGESKLDILNQIDPVMRPVVAPATGFTTDPADASQDTVAAEAAMQAAGLAYPVVVKPDIGCNGAGVRLIRARGDFDRYFPVFPRRTRAVLQEFVPYPGEAGLFYVRQPHEATGRITSLTIKIPPVVTGDGRRTLRELVLDDPRAGKVPDLYLPRLAHRLAEIPPSGERVRLVFAGNHCRGSIFRNGQDHATPALTRSIERLARALPEFHFGRIDVRYRDLASLRRGEGFRVIEVNGAGSEATHIWDPSTTLADAWRTQFFHYGQAFRIGAANRARGFASSGVRAMARGWRTQRRLMSAYPLND